MLLIVNVHKFRTFLIIWAVPRSAVFWMVAVVILQFSCSMLSFRFVVIAPNDPTTIGITLMLVSFHTFLNSILRSWYASIFSCSFLLTLTSPGTAMSIISALFSFLYTITMSGLLCSITLSVWILKSHSILTSFDSITFSAWCSYHLSVQVML